MNRHELLRQLHAIARPRNYLEIGVNDGRSLSLSWAPSIAIDPSFKITTPMRCDRRGGRSTGVDRLRAHASDLLPPADAAAEVGSVL